MRIFLLLFIIVSGNAYSQQTAKFYLEFHENVREPSVSKSNKKDQFKIQTGNLRIDSIFGKYKVYKFEKAFPTAKTLRLQRTYIINTDNIKLMYDLRKLAPEMYFSASEIMEPVLLYTPNDYGGEVASVLTSSQTNLDLIRAKEAWDITKGDPSVIIGITDTYFELSHEDMAGQIVLARGTNSSSVSDAYHGTTTAGFVAAATNNSKGIAAIAFNCKMMVSSNWGSDNELLVLSQLGARVLNASWLNDCNYNSTVQLVYDEIRANGTVMVASAGNSASHCGSRNAYVYPASYNNVISVSSVGHRNNIGYVDPVYGANNWKDVHEEVPGNPNTSHHHNDKVDICAPGYNVVSTNINNGYIGAWGTSFSGPQVAGVCALIISANICLTPDEVENILKSSAVNIDNITENLPYAGLLGAGRVDAYEAVKRASILGTVTLQNINIPGTVEYEAAYALKAIGNVTIPSGSNVYFEARDRVEVQGPFDVELGAEFSIKTGNVTIVCPY